MRWVCGLVLLFIGLFAAAAVFFSYFCWREDQSGLPMSAADRAALSIEPKNFCGWAGARLGMWLVDRSFGLFGILIPVMIVLLGVRIIRQRPLLLNHSLLVARLRDDSRFVYAGFRLFRQVRRSVRRPAWAVLSVSIRPSCFICISGR